VSTHLGAPDVRRVLLGALDEQVPQVRQQLPHPRLVLLRRVWGMGAWDIRLEGYKLWSMRTWGMGAWDIRLEGYKLWSIRIWGMGAWSIRLEGYSLVLLRRMGQRRMGQEAYGRTGARVRG
jgi:hypothetical protein